MSADDVTNGGRVTRRATDGDDVKMGIHRGGLAPLMHSYSLSEDDFFNAPCSGLDLTRIYTPHTGVSCEELNVKGGFYIGTERRPASTLGLWAFAWLYDDGDNDVRVNWPHGGAASCGFGSLNRNAASAGTNSG